MNNKNLKGLKNISFYIALMMMIMIVVVFVGYSMSRSATYTPGMFKKALKQGEVEAVEIHPNEETPTGFLRIRLENGSIVRMNVADVTEWEKTLDDEKDVDYIVTEPEKESWLITTLLPCLITVGAVMLVFYLISGQNAGGGGGKMMNFGKSRAKMTTEKKVRFKDVAGCDEEKEDLKEIVDFLKAPDKYLKVGARQSMLL